jgi:hypothetical protein
MSSGNTKEHSRTPLWNLRSPAHAMLPADDRTQRLHASLYLNLGESSRRLQEEDCRKKIAGRRLQEEGCRKKVAGRRSAKVRCTRYDQNRAIPPAGKWLTTVRREGGGFLSGRRGGPRDLARNHAALFAVIEVRRFLSSEILNVNVSTQSHVVGQIPARIVGILVEHDVITVP